MTRQTLTYALAMLMAASVGCGSDEPTASPDAAPDATVDTGRGGTGGVAAGGAGGSGRIDASSDSSDTASDLAADGSSPDGGVDGAPDAPDATAPDAPGSDAVDVPVVVDVPVETAVDMAPVEPAPITITSCAQIDCPALMDIVSTCNGSNEDCVSLSTPGPVITVTNYCHENGVKKVATYNDTTKLISMRVIRSNNTACYTLDMTPGASASIENWTYKTPTGTVLGTAVSEQTPPGSKITLKCNGKTYIINTAAVDCAGTDGQPGPNECTTGACSP